MVKLRYLRKMLKRGREQKTMSQKPLQRQQFTFYSSYFSAVENLPQCHKLEALQGIIRYALFGQEPELRGPALSVFKAIRPNLDSGRGKAEYRMRKLASEPAEPRSRSSRCPDQE